MPAPPYNLVVYERAYAQGTADNPYNVRAKINMVSVINGVYYTAGAQTNDANLATNSKAEILFDTMSDFGSEEDAANTPRLRKQSSATWTMTDTPANDFRTNVLIPAVQQAASGVRLVVRLDCDYGNIMRGAYSGATAYAAGDVVSYTGAYYVCILSTSAGIAPSNQTYWVAYECDASGFVRDFTGIIDPQQIDGKFLFASFGTGQIDERFTLTALPFETLSIESLPWGNLSAFGPDYPDSSTSLYETMTEFWRAWRYYSAKSPSWGTTFDTSLINGALVAGQWTDWDFAPLSRIMRSLANFVRWNLAGGQPDGAPGNGDAVTLAYDITMDHFLVHHHIDVGFGAHTYSAGYPTNDLADRVVLNKHIFMANMLGYPPGTLPSFAYQSYNLDAQYIAGTATGGNYANIADAFTAFLQSFLMYANIHVSYDFAGNEKVTLRATSPVSPTIKSLIYGDPELLTLRNAHDVTPGFTPANAASVSLKKPAGIDKAYTDNAAYFYDSTSGANQYPGADNSPVDMLNPTYIVPMTKGSQTVNIAAIAGSWWGDWAENQLAFIFDTGVPTKVAACDFGLDLTASGAYPPNTPVTFTQTWGGGKLNSGSANTAKTITVQHAWALQLYSMYCGGAKGGTLKGVEKIVATVDVTAAISAMLQDATLRAITLRGFDGATYRYMVIGTKWNSWKVKGANIRTVTFTAIRTID